MPLRIKCPSGHTLIVPDDRAGRTLTCPRCDQLVVVPAATAQVRSSSGMLSSKAPVPDELISLIARDIGGSQASVAVAEKVDLRRGDDTSQDRDPDQRLSYENQLPRPVVKPKSRVLPLPAPPPQPPPALPPVEALRPQEAAPEKGDKSHIEPLHVEAPLPARTAAPSMAPDNVEKGDFEKGDKSSFEPSPAAAIEAHPSFEKAAPVLARSADVAAEPAAAVAAEPVSEPTPPPYDDPPPPMDEPAPPPFVPRAEPAAVSLHADAASTLAVYQLVAALVAAAVFSVVPAIWDLVEYLQVAESQFIARWALGLFFLGVVQLAYAVYLFQLPDWTTVWVVTVFSLFVAAIHAAVLGLVLLPPADGFLVGQHGLQLADKLTGGKAALWCLCMVSLSTILAFFSGRLSARWHKTEMLLRACS